MKIGVIVWIFCGIYSLAHSKVQLNVNMGSEPRSFDPQLSVRAPVVLDMFEGLYYYHPKTALPVKAMAESASKNEDATVWTFQLKKDYFWVRRRKNQLEKVRAVTAHDFVYSYRRMLSAKTAAAYAYMLFIIKNGKAFHEGKVKDPSQIGVKALDDYTLQVTLEGPVPNFIQYLSHNSYFVVPKEPIEQHGAHWEKPQHIWVNGPYILKDWKLKDRVEIEKNPFYREAKEVQVEDIHFHFLPEHSAEASRAFQVGQIDIDMVSPPQHELKERTKEQVIVASQLLSTAFLDINVTTGSLKDKRVRRALALTIPRQRIIKYVTKMQEPLATSLVPQGIPGYTPISFSNELDFAKRAAEARKLLSDAGYSGGKGIPKLNYNYPTSPLQKKIAVILSKTWKKELGIELNLVNQDWKSHYAAVQALDYSIASAGWTADLIDPINFLEIYETAGGNNSTGFSHAEFDGLIVRARVEINLKKRNAILSRAEAILMNELPVLPIYRYVVLSSKHSYVSGYFPNRLNRHLFRFVKLDAKKRKLMFPKRY